MNDQARALLSKYAEAHQPATAAAQRSLEAIETRLAAGDPGLPLGSAGGGKAALAAKAFAAGVAVTALVAFAMRPTEPPTEPPSELPATTPSSDAIAEAPAADREPEVKPPTQSQPPSESTVASTPTPEALPVETSESAPRPPTARKKRAVKKVDDTPEPVPASTLKEEMALLGRGQRALQSGQPRDALTHFEAHARRFPNGLMRREREAKMIVAYCELGQTKEAQRRRDRFLRRHPQSPLAASVSEVCK